MAVILGLTGGIGSGKSTVSASLATRGAVVIDADAITRELQEPGRPVFDAIVERFGTGVVDADGRLDRQALADIVFPDPDALADLNAIVHPAVGSEVAARLDAARGVADVVVLDIPLLVETGRTGLDAVLVVDTDPAIALERLVASRGLRREDAELRMARQATRDERRAVADFVIVNDGSIEDLDGEIDRLWPMIVALADR